MSQLGLRICLPTGFYMVVEQSAGNDAVWFQDTDEPEPDHSEDWEG